MRKNDVEKTMICGVPNDSEAAYYITKDKTIIKKKQIHRSINSYRVVDCNITEKEKEWIRKNYGNEEQLYQKLINYNCHKKPIIYELGLKEMLSASIKNDIINYKKNHLELLKIELSFASKRFRKQYIERKVTERRILIDQMKAIENYYKGKSFSKINVLDIDGQSMVDMLSEQTRINSRPIKIAAERIDEDTFIVNGQEIKQPIGTLGWHCYNNDIDGRVKVNEEK